MCVHTQKGNEGINISGTPLCEKESSVVKGTHTNSYTNSITCRGLIFMVYYGGGFNKYLLTYSMITANHQQQI